MAPSSNANNGPLATTTATTTTTTTTNNPNSADRGASRSSSPCPVDSPCDAYQHGPRLTRVVGSNPSAKANVAAAVLPFSLLVKWLLVGIVLQQLFGVCCEAAPLLDLKRMRDELNKQTEFELLKNKFKEASLERGGVPGGGGGDGNISLSDLPSSLREEMERAVDKANYHSDYQEPKEELVKIILKAEQFHEGQGAISKEVAFYFRITERVESVVFAQISFDRDLLFADSLKTTGGSTLKHFWVFQPEPAAQMIVTADFSFLLNDRQRESIDVEVAPKLLHEMFLNSRNVAGYYKLVFAIVSEETFIDSAGQAVTKKHFRALQRMPFLYLKYKPDTLSRRGRAIAATMERECGSGPVESCCLQRGNVTLHEIGWQHEVSIPNVIPFNYCRGSCTGTMDHYTSFNARIRAMVRSNFKMMNLVDQGKDPLSSCCGATKYMPLIYYKTSVSGSERMILPDAIVTGCGCI